MKSLLTSTHRGRYLVQKLSAVVLVLGAAGLLVAGCGGGSDSTSASGGTSTGSGGGSSDGDVTIGLLAPETTDNTYSATYTQHLSELADEDNVELKIYNAKYDAATQAAQAESLIAQKPDLIILWPADSRAVLPILLKAQQAGIPVNVSNSEISEEDAQYIETFTGPSNAEIGRTCAKLISEALGGKGKIVIEEGQPGNATNLGRVEAFKEELPKVAPNIETVGDQPTDWLQAKAVSVTSQFLSRFNNEIDGIYANDDIVGAGASQAIEQAGIPKGQIKIVATGGNKLGLPLVADGSVYATMFQSPVKDSELAMENALKVVEGEEVPPHTYLEMPVITKKNVSEFTPEW